jgi:hypothetical protein
MIKLELNQNQSEMPIRTFQFGEKSVRSVQTWLEMVGIGQKCQFEPATDSKTEMVRIYFKI